MTEGASMRERMLAGELYIADDPELARDAGRARRLSHQLNTADPTDGKARRELLTELLGRLVGAGSVVVADLPPDVVAVGNPARVVRAVEP